MVTLEASYSFIAVAKWSPDSTRIFTAGRDGLACICDARTGETLVVMSGHRKTIYGGGWSPDGKYILTTSSDETARIWDASTGEQLQTILIPANASSVGSWSSDGQRVLLGWTAGTVTVLDVITQEPVLVMPTKEAVDLIGEWSPDDRYILTGHPSGGAQLWSASTGLREKQVGVGQDGRFVAGSWSPNSEQVVLCNWHWHGFSKIWNVKTGHESCLLESAWDATADWSPDGVYVLIGSNARWTVWHAATEKRVFSLPWDGGAICRVAWSPDGRRIVTGSADSVRVWDLGTGLAHPMASVLAQSGDFYALLDIYEEHGMESVLLTHLRHNPSSAF